MNMAELRCLQGKSSDEGLLLTLGGNGKAFSGLLPWASMKMRDGSDAG